MKSLNKIFTLLILAIFLISCSNPTNEELIVGEWRFADFKIASKDITPNEEVQLSMLKVLFEKMSLTYFNDKTYESKMSLGNEKYSENGTYRFEGDGKYLVSEGTDQEGKIKNSRSEIIKLTKDSLIIGGDEGYSLTLVKSK